MDSNPSEDTPSHEKEMALMIDPPGGWRYGFPVEFAPYDEERVEDFLIRKGFPKEEAGFAAKYCRYWRGDPCNEY